MRRPDRIRVARAVRARGSESRARAGARRLRINPHATLSPLRDDARCPHPHSTSSNALVHTCLELLEKASSSGLLRRFRGALFSGACAHERNLNIKNSYANFLCSTVGCSRSLLIEDKNCSRISLILKKVVRLYSLD